MQATSQQRPHALYRFYDATGTLLYIGITLDPAARWQAHRQDKPWWAEVARITLEKHPDRPAVLEAERQAITREQPRYNVVHNLSGPRNKSKPVELLPTVSPATGSYDSTLNDWTFQSRRTGHARTSDLYLDWEVEGTAMSDDWTPDEISARSLLGRWARRYGAHQVPIYWIIRPLAETAPFQTWLEESAQLRDFLSYYTWPRNVHTGERLNFNRLPVLNQQWNTTEYDKGGFFQEATGWKPAPLQSHVDLARVFVAAGLPLHLTRRRDR